MRSTRSRAEKPTKRSDNRLKRIRHLYLISVLSRFPNWVRYSRKHIGNSEKSVCFHTPDFD